MNGWIQVSSKESHKNNSRIGKQAIQVQNLGFLYIQFKRGSESD